MSWAAPLVHAEAVGTMFLDVVQPGDLVDLVGWANDGSDRSRRLIAEIEKALKAIEQAPQTAPISCATCPRPIRPRGDFHLCIAAPARSPRSHGLTLAICSKCAMKREDARTKSLVALRRIWPDIRAIRVLHEAGRA